MNKEIHLKVKGAIWQCSLSQSSRLSNSSANSGTGGFGVTYRSTGVSTLIGGGSSGHRHSQRHSGNQPQSYLRSSIDAGRRRGWIILLSSFSLPDLFKFVMVLPL